MRHPLEKVKLNMKANELKSMRKPHVQVALVEKLIEFPRNNQIGSSVGELGGKIEAVLNSQ